MIEDSRIIPVDLAKVLMGGRRSFVSGDANTERLRVEFFKRVDNHTLGAKVWFGEGTEGAPGIVHGGSISAVLEEVMRFAAWVSGNAVLTIRLSTNFKKMLPLNSHTLVTTLVEVADAQKMRITSQLLNAQDEVMADAEGLFMVIPSEKFGMDAKKVADMFAALS